jgi:predicted SAM-dependent methyltransferase
MLLRLVKNLLGHRTPVATPSSPNMPLRLHIGGKTRQPGWQIVDTVAEQHVDYVRSCTDLSIFADNSVAEIYVSHVLEHLGYQSELAGALDEFHRVLKPGGTLRASVPDLSTLCALFVDPALESGERFHVMRMIFGGQLSPFDFHKVGLSEEFLAGYLASAGFTGIERVDAFGLFEDSSSIVFRGRPVSLNLAARKRNG